MRTNEAQSIKRWWMWATVVASVVLLNSAIGQDTKSTEKAGEKAAASANDAKADTSAAANTTPAVTSPSATGETSPAAGAADASKATSEKGAPSNTTSTGDAKAESDSPSTPGKSADSSSKTAQTKGAATGEPETGGSSKLIILLVLVALFVLPTMAGNYLAKLWRMPDHAWKISLSLGVLAGSIVVCVAAWQHWWGSQFKFGPDLAGGITLIYELQDAPKAVANPNQPNQPNSPGSAPQVKSGGKEFTMSKLIDGLKRRLDPDGTKEITIREYGPAVEIIIPQVGQDEMDFVQDKITKMGQLEFRITADANIPKDKSKIEAAKLVPPTKQEVMLGEALVAKWVPYDENEFGPVDRPDGYVKRKAGDTPEILVLIDTYNVTGDYLTSATKGIDDHGMPAVHFAFNSAGAQRFERLTGQNTPNPATPDVFRHLGILLDGKLVNAPTIRTTISDRGMISGGTMTDRDVELNVQVLDAGSLPAALNKTPISQEIISPTLGGQTIDQAKRAIIASLLGVVIFMLIYYRFAGLIACIALTLNLIMVLALMVLIKAAFTLPGLAGLALTVGMSVDTNVLIYERIREELASGAAMRMAIRNGFDRAMRAIIDTHLTTIISGVVLFYVGTDQVRGFAVTLVLGIVTNLFTAFFCTRLMFDIFERRGMIKDLKMMHIFSNPNFDFLRYRWIMLGFSWALIAIGMVAVYFRGSQLLDIDFTGGSSVTFTLNEKDRMSQSEVHATLRKTDLENKNLLVVGRQLMGELEHSEKNAGFTIDTSEQSVNKVKQILVDSFGPKLKKYSFDFSDLKAVADPDFTGTEAKLTVNAGAEYKGEEGMSHDALRDQILATLAEQGHPGARISLSNSGYRAGSGVRFSEWTLRVAALDEAATRSALEKVQSELQNTPLFPLANNIGGRVSSNMQFQAFLAIGISLLAMIAYLWFRFQKPAYGIAAGIALIHDVLMTVGMIALSYYIVETVPGFANLLKIDAFQINLTIVAALLTIIGYSVNDTIVTFDRLREIKGKSPRINANMVNDAVNQTLGRTILTVFTVFIVVVILYFYGGDGLHSFAFAFMVGVVVGTYSSIYVASPALLWLSGESAATKPAEPAAPSTRGMQPAR